MSRIARRAPYHGVCPPGYEKVRPYNRDDGTHVTEHCRKIRVEGRTRAALSGLYNEGMIAQEDARLSFDSVVDSTRAGEKNAGVIERRARHIKEIMHEQEERKDQVRETEK